MYGRSLRRAIAVASALGMASVASAVPAYADHAAEISADGERCILGALASARMGLGFKLVTSKATIDFDPATGDLVYTCHFDIPDYKASENTIYMQHDWYLPDRPITANGIRCLPPGALDLSVESYNSRMVITPAGTGILRCSFPSFRFIMTSARSRPTWDGGHAQFGPSF